MTTPSIMPRQSERAKRLKLFEMTTRTMVVGVSVLLMFSLPVYVDALDNGSSSSSNSNSNSSHNTTDPRVFWSVNAFIVFFFCTACSWFWCCGGVKVMERLQLNPQDSDLRYQERQLARLEERNQARTMNPDERKAKILRSFEENRVKMIVEQADFVAADSSKNHDDSQKSASFFHHDDLEGQQLEQQLACSPTADESMGSDTDFQQQQLLLRPSDRTVPNLCAICLGAYRTGDSVVWSSNPNCSHAFHEDCLLDWLVYSTAAAAVETTTTDVALCPCCRQSFAQDLVSFRKERKIRWGAQNTFNPSVLTLR